MKSKITFLFSFVLKAFSVLLLVFLTTGSAFGQFNIGVSAGRNYTNVFVKNVHNVFGWEEYEVTNPIHKKGFHIGVVGEYGIDNNFAVQSGIIFAMQGYKAAQKDIVVGDIKGHEVEIKVNINYLQIPVNAQYKMSLGRGALLFQTGPYFGFALGGKMTSQLIGNGVPVSEKKKTDLSFGGKKEQLSPFDFGIGFGIEIPLDGIQFGLRYQLGIANLYNVEDVKMKNRGFEIKLAYYFSRK